MGEYAHPTDGLELSHVTQFAPNIRTMEPPEAPDALGMPCSKAWPGHWSKIPAAHPCTHCSGVSSALASCLCWNCRGNSSGGRRIEQQQLLHLAQWVGSHGQPSEATQELQADARRLAPSRLINIVGFWAIIALVAYFWIQMRTEFHVALTHGLWISTYGYPSPFGRLGQGYGVPWRLYVIWNMALCFGFALQWLRLQLHVIQVRLFLERFNKLAGAEGIPPVEPAPRHSGLGVRWILGAILFCWLGGAWWAVPDGLGGGSAAELFLLHQSYGLRGIWPTGCGPGLFVAGREPRFRCRCCCGGPARCRCAGRFVPDSAVFCPRCGTHLPTAMPRGA